MNVYWHRRTAVGCEGGIAERRTPGMLALGFVALVKSAEATGYANNGYKSK